MKCWYFLSILVIFGSCILLSWCSHRAMPSPQSSVTAITAWEAWGLRASGLGLRLDESHILTAAHVVASDYMVYRAEDVDYRVVWRDAGRDVAILARRNASTVPEISFAAVLPWDQVSTLVIRDGVEMVLTGVVLTGSTALGYRSDGRLQSLEAIVLHTIPVRVGESGAPVWNASGALVDVIHIENKNIP